MKSPIVEKSRLMTPKAAAEATSMSRSLLHLLSKEGRFPEPVKLSAQRTAYVRAEVDEWIDQQIAARSKT